MKAGPHLHEVWGVQELAKPAGLERTMRRLQRVKFSDPVSLVAAHRRHVGTFWSGLAMSRHNHRMTLAVRTPELLPSSIYRGLMHVPRMDAILGTYGKLWSLDPDGLELAGEENWPGHIQWGADRLVDLARHLRAGRTIAALITTRHQLERWTLNVAHHHSIEPADDEGTADFFTRVWAVYPHLAFDGGAAWKRLSEWLHGRDVQQSLWEKEAGRMNRHSYDAPAGTIELHEAIADVAVALFVQVRGCVAALALDERPDWSQLMQNEFAVSSVSDFPDPLPTASHPLDPPLAFGTQAEMHLLGANLYRSEVAKAARNNEVERLTEGRLIAGMIFERRSRAVARFRQAWETEKKLMGDEFTPGTLGARLFRYIAICETAEVLADLTTNNDERRHLEFAASALRSAFYYWLEDTHLSLPCIRSLVEHTCAARTWRTKSAKAERIETATGRAGAPSRWIEASGWQRAALLGQALGEFSHISLRARWLGAFDLLTQIQAEDTDAPMLTARGHALDVAAYLLSLEISDRLRAIDERMADGFANEVTLLDTEKHLKTVEGILQRIADKKGFDFGEPIFGVDPGVASEA